METVGIVNLVSGKNAVVTIQKGKDKEEIESMLFVGSENQTNVIIKNKCGVKESEKVSVKISDRFSKTQKYLFYTLPLIMFLIGFGVGFLFPLEIAHFGLMMGMYGLGMLITLIVKDYALKNKFKIEMKKLEGEENGKNI